MHDNPKNVSGVSPRTTTRLRTLRAYTGERQYQIVDRLVEQEFAALAASSPDGDSMRAAEKAAYKFEIERI